MDNYQRIIKSLGTKYFKKVGDNYEVIRVIGIKNSDNVLISKNGETVTINPKVIDDEYTALISDGIITFSIVKMRKTEDTFYEDVVVCLHRRSDLDLGNAEPVVVCRQNITDIFYNYLKNDETTEYVGLSVSKATCPENIEFEIMRACDDISYSVGVNFYIEDSIDDILKMIKVKKFNSILESGFADFCKRTNRFNTSNLQSILGHCKSLDLLLKENNFIYDYNAAFKITGLEVDLYNYIIKTKDEVSEYNTLNSDMITELSDIFKINIANTIVLEYNHDIDLEEIKSKFILIRDINNKLFIINYITDGEYREKDLEVIAAGEALKRTSSIMFNKDKYK